MFAQKCVLSIAYMLSFFCFVQCTAPPALPPLPTAPESRKSEGGSGTQPTSGSSQPTQPAPTRWSAQMSIRINNLQPQYKYEFNMYDSGNPGEIYAHIMFTHTRSKVENNTWSFDVPTIYFIVAESYRRDANDVLNTVWFRVQNTTLKKDWFSTKATFTPGVSKYSVQINTSW